MLWLDEGIDMTTQGLLFKSINMRGFGATGNPRTVQMIDGMDNQAPGLNFPVDNIVGMPELMLKVLRFYQERHRLFMAQMQSMVRF